MFVERRLHASAFRYDERLPTQERKMSSRNKTVTFAVDSFPKIAK
jgi:hypothetical protein